MIEIKFEEMMNNEEQKYLHLKSEVSCVNCQVEEIDRIFSENKRVKKENLEDRLKEIEELETCLTVLMEENIDIRKSSENKMKK